MLATRYTELELRVCPPILLEKSQKALLSKVFLDFATGISTSHADLLNILRRVAE